MLYIYILLRVYSNVLLTAIVFDLTLVDDSVPESVGNVLVTITPQVALPVEVVLSIISSSDSATGGRRIMVAIPCLLHVYMLRPDCKPLAWLYISLTVGWATAYGYNYR